MKDLETPMRGQQERSKKDPDIMAEWQEFRIALMEIRDDSRMLYSIYTSAPETIDHQQQEPNGRSTIPERMMYNRLGGKEQRPITFH